MDHQRYLENEYKKQGKKPVKCELGNNTLIVPASYNGNMDKFIDDFTAFQDNEWRKYENYNKRNPQNTIEPREIKVKTNATGHIRFIVPLNMARRNMSDKAIAEKCITKAIAQYKKSVKLTKRLNEENPKEKPTLVSLSKKHFHHCHNEHAKYVAKKIAQKTGKALKWSAKQTADVAIGLLGSPILGVYKLLDKKYHYKENDFSKFLDRQITPRLKKTALLTAISAATLIGIKNNNNVDDKDNKENNKKANIEVINKKSVQEKLAQEEMNAFFKKYNTTDTVFYQNFKTAEENEAFLIAMLACPEGFREKAYLCPSNVATMGFGTTTTVVERESDGKKELIAIPVTLGMTTTKEKAYKDAQYHLRERVFPQLQHVNKVLSDTENIAVCMFIYNTGENAFSTSALCKKINKNADNETIRKTFSLYRSANNKRNYGLITRRGFEGYIYCCENIEELLTLKPTIVGSPDITYYKYSADNKKDPLENADKTFALRDIKDIENDALKFQTTKFDKCVLAILPNNKAQEVIAQFGYHIDDQGTLKKTEGQEKRTRTRKRKNNNMG